MRQRRIYVEEIDHSCEHLRGSILICVRRFHFGLESALMTYLARCVQNVPLAAAVWHTRIWAHQSGYNLLKRGPSFMGVSSIPPFSIEYDLHLRRATQRKHPTFQNKDTAHSHQEGASSPTC